MGLGKRLVRKIKNKHKIIVDVTYCYTCNLFYVEMYELGEVVYGGRGSGFAFYFTYRGLR
jgi:hypothetical protein